MASGAMSSSCARNSALLRIFSGCTTAIPAARAACFTGGAVSWCVRPTGRSGCETTSEISCPAPSSASNVGTANPGVPQKTSFTALPLAVGLHLADLAQIQAALQRAHPEQKKNAIQVVDLVLEGARQQIIPVHLEPFALLILRTDANLGGAHNLLANVGEAEAAFLLVQLALAQNNLGIDQHQLGFGPLAHADVDHGHAF